MPPADELMRMAQEGLGNLFLAVALVGTVWLALSNWTFARFFGRVEASPPARRDDAVTMLKPLCGAEPLLPENLASFVDQHHDGPLQIVCGVARGDDAAIHAVAHVRDARPDATVELVVSPDLHGTSLKVSNLVNMDARARHPIVILSDSDMAVDPDYVSRVLDALDGPNVGAVSLLYCGRGDAGFWSTLGAAGLSYQFLPGAVFGVATAIATPCMGSTIAIRRETLDRIGGLRRFADKLADDYAIGEAVRGLGLAIAVPPMVIEHACSERSLRELWCHEMRWARTVRSVVPLGYAASVLSMPLPLAAIGFALSPHAAGAALCLCAMLLRVLQAGLIDRRLGRRTAGRWILPIRDAFSFAVFLASYLGRSVDWRGARHRAVARRRLATDQEFPA